MFLTKWRLLTIVKAEQQTWMRLTLVSGRTQRSMYVPVEMAIF